MSEGLVVCAHTHTPHSPWKCTPFFWCALTCPKAWLFHETHPAEVKHDTSGISSSMLGNSPVVIGFFRRISKYWVTQTFVWVSAQTCKSTDRLSYLNLRHATTLTVPRHNIMALYLLQARNCIFICTLCTCRYRHSSSLRRQVQLGNLDLYGRLRPTLDNWVIWWLICFLG